MNVIEGINNKKIPRLHIGPQFSFYRMPVTNTIPYRNITLYDVYKYLTGDYAKKQTEILRTITDKSAARAYKGKNFDTVSFAGMFKNRDDASIIHPSDLLCLDLDHVPNVQMYRQLLLADPEFETALMFTSPSGDGIKWVVTIKTDCHTYGQVFTAVSNYMKATYGLIPDPACKNISRACYLPHDPEAYLNPKYLPFNVIQ